MAGEALRFPPDFVWGTATSAYQIEGAWRKHGKGESIWDRFSHTPRKIAGGHTGDVAADHYHRWEDDIDALVALGVRAYRFSISWPRLFPTGRGQPNEQGVDFYRRLLGALRERNIQPMVTLYHWDLPQALQDRGGWTNRETALRFADYAAYCFDRFGADVPWWVTINEPFMVSFMGHGVGLHAPGRRRFWQMLRVAHYLLLAHGLATRAFRAANLPPAADIPAPGIGIVLNIWPNHPFSQHPRDVRANHRFNAIANQLFLEMLFRGHYPADVLPLLMRRLLHPPILPGDLETISQPLDFVGINTYSRLVNRAVPYDPVLGVRPVTPVGPRTAMGWEIYPPCVYEALHEVRAYTETPIFITENGAAFDDKRGPDGQIDDTDRIDYLRAHLAEAHRAIRDGVDLRGYFAWSLLDNFEWEHGYSKRFGLIYVDFETGERIWKRSASWYRDVIARNAIHAPTAPPVPQHPPDQESPIIAPGR